MADARGHSSAQREEDEKWWVTAAERWAEVKDENRMDIFTSITAMLHNIRSTTERTTSQPDKTLLF